MTPEESCKKFYEDGTCKQFALSGQVCQWHDVEVERRKDLKGMAEALTKTVETLTSWKHTMLGVGVLGVAVVLGSYYFTADSKLDFKEADIRIEKRVERLGTQVSALATTIAVNEARHTALMIQMERLTKTLEQQNRNINSSSPWGGNG